MYICIYIYIYIYIHAYIHSSTTNDKHNNTNTQTTLTNTHRRIPRLCFTTTTAATTTTTTTNDNNNDISSNTTVLMTMCLPRLDVFLRSKGRGGMEAPRSPLKSNNINQHKPKSTSNKITYNI